MSGEIEKEEFVNLCQLAMKDQELAIGYCESLISRDFESFDDFLEAKRAKNCCCDVSWSQPRLVVTCHDCERTAGSEICLECFRKSEHAGHRTALKIATSGTCCCGNVYVWKSGCGDHPGGMHCEQTKHTMEENTFYVSIFVALLSDLNFVVVYDPERFVGLCDWFSVLANLNPDMRQCVAVAWVQQRCFHAILAEIDVYNDMIQARLAKFIESMLADHIFILKYAREVYSCQCTYAEFLIRCARNDLSSEYMKPMIQCSTHAYIPVLMESIIAKGYDWTLDVTEFFSKVVDTVLKDKTGALYMKCGLDRITTNMIAIMSHAVRMPEQATNVQVLFNRLAVLFAKIEGLQVFPLLLPSERSDFMGLYVVMYWMHNVTAIFAEVKGGLKSEALFAAVFRFMVAKLMNDRFDTDRKVLLFQRSLFKTALFSPMLPCHMLMSVVLSMQGSDTLAFVQRYVGRSITVNNFCLFTSVLPLRWFAVCHLSMLKVMPVASRGIHFWVKSFMGYAAVTSGFVQLFTLVQTCFGLIAEKDVFIYEMANLYGLFEAQEDAGSYKKVRFAFFFALACLLTDSECRNRDSTAMAKKTILCHLYMQPMTIGSLREKTPGKSFDTEKFGTELKPFIDVIKSPKGTLWKLKEGVMCDPFLPWMNTTQVLNTILEFGKHNPDKLIPFPDILPSKGGLSYSGVLSSPVVLAIMYVTLSDACQLPEYKSSECIQIVLNLLLMRSKINTIHERQTISKVVIPNYAALANFLQNLVFVRVLWTPFEWVDRGTGANSFVDLIAKLGPVGVTCLEQMDIGYTREVPIVNDARARAKQLRMQMTEQFRDRQSRFEFEAGDVAEDTFDVDLCSICNQPANNEDALWFPAVMYTATLPLGQPAPDSYCFRLCQHLVHLKCIGSASLRFKCPVDRLRRSILIPNLKDVGYDAIPESAVKQLRIFRASVGDKAKTSYEVATIAKAFVRHITMCELQMRSNDTIDFKTRLLLRNIFLVLWHMNHTLNWEIGQLGPLPLETLVERTILSDDRCQFGEYAKEIAMNMSAPNRTVFMRQAVLLNALVLCDEKDVNLRDLMSADSLQARFALDIEDCDLRPFALFDLPKDFLDLAVSPYNIPIDDMHESRGLCLLTGKVLRVDCVRDASRMRTLMKHMEEDCGRNATFILVISGQDTGTMFLATPGSDKVKIRPSVYVDDIGDEAVGFGRGEFLRLHEDRLLHCANMLLSGEWADCNAPA